MNLNFYEELHAKGLISDNSFEQIKQDRLNTLFSLHWELQTLLCLGVTLLSAGLGILVYKNIDTISHQAILTFIALLSAGCFIYCFKNKLPFSKQQVNSPNAGFDYILLLGAVSMVTFFGYLQFKYQVFGVNSYGMATLIPMLGLFFIAYYFDHLGVLTMAIISLALWMGISVTPKQLLAYGNFNSEAIIYTYLTFSFILLIAAAITQSYRFKSHFKFSYYHYGVHVTMITIIAGYGFYYDSNFALLWLLGLFIMAAYFGQDAYKTKSFYFMMITILYAYVGLSCLMMRMLMAMRGDLLVVYFAFIYFVGTAVTLVVQLIRLHKLLKTA